MPGRYVLRSMEVASEELRRAARERLGAEEVAWVKSLVHYGKFSRLPVMRGWSKEDKARAEERGIKVGVVRRNVEGDLVPAYPLTQSELRRSYETSLQE